MTAPDESDTPRTARILAGLPDHTNEQACFDGARGFWVQTDCVLIERDTPEEAITEFRRKMRDGGHVAVCHNMGTSGIRLLQANERIAQLERELASRAAQADAMAKALQSITDEAIRHHEHNAVSGKDRLPVGYTRILNMADAALRAHADALNPQTKKKKT